MSEAVKLNYETSGDRENPALVLIHGLFGDADNLKSISRELSDSYYVVNVELRNHGSSPWTDSMPFPSHGWQTLALFSTPKTLNKPTSLAIP